MRYGQLDMGIPKRQQLQMELDTLLSEAKWDWAHSSHCRTMTVEEFYVRYLLRWLEQRNGDFEERRGWTIWVPGEPVPWGMGKAVRGGWRLKPQRLKDWQDKVLLSWRQCHQSAKISGPTSLSFTFHCSKARMDTSNLIKGAEDALKTHAVPDDSYVYEICARKVPAEDGHPIGMEMSVGAYMGYAFPKHSEEGS